MAAEPGPSGDTPGGLPGEARGTTRGARLCACGWHCRPFGKDLEWEPEALGPFPASRPLKRRRLLHTCVGDLSPHLAAPWGQLGAQQPPHSGSPVTAATRCFQTSSAWWGRLVVSPHHPRTSLGPCLSQPCVLAGSFQKCCPLLSFPTPLCGLLPALPSTLSAPFVAVLPSPTAPRASGVGLRPCLHSLLVTWCRPAGH